MYICVHIYIYMCTYMYIYIYNVYNVYNVYRGSDFFQTDLVWIKRKRWWTRHCWYSKTIVGRHIPQWSTHSEDMFFWFTGKPIVSVSVCLWNPELQPVQHPIKRTRLLSLVARKSPSYSPQATQVASRNKGWGYEPSINCGIPCHDQTGSCVGICPDTTCLATAHRRPLQGPGSCACGHDLTRTGRPSRASSWKWVGHSCTLRLRHFEGFLMISPQLFLIRAPKKQGAASPWGKLRRLRRFMQKKARRETWDVAAKTRVQGFTRRYSTTDSSWLSQSLWVKDWASNTLVACCCRSSAKSNSAFGRLATLRLLRQWIHKLALC